VARLVDLFESAKAVDEKVSRINRSGPPGEHRRLLGVELTARGLESFQQLCTMPAEPHVTRLRGRQGGAASPRVSFAPLTGFCALRPFGAYSVPEPASTIS
jgi:hypothetical protein